METPQEDQPFRGRMFFRAVLVCAVIPVLVVELSAQTGVDPRPLTADSDFWRTTRYCGVNAVYLMLRLNGLSSEYEDIKQSVPVDESGSNLEDMKLVLRERGLHARVVKATPSDLANCPLPCVAHVERDEGTRFSEADRGHYIILLQADDRQIQYIDCTTSVMRTKPLSMFLREWSGYLLIADSTRGPIWSLAAACGSALFLLGSWWLFLGKRQPADRSELFNASAPAPSGS